MAIDRSWWNALVDDDGSGNTGSVWNKAAIKGLLDAIDGLHESGVWTPRFAASAGGTPIHTVQKGVWARSDKLVTAGGHIEISSKGSMSGVIRIMDLPKLSSTYVQQGGFSVGYFGGLLQNLLNVTGTIDAGGNWITLFTTGGTGALSQQYLVDGHIGNTLALVFAATYRID